MRSEQMYIENSNKRKPIMDSLKAGNFFQTPEPARGYKIVNMSTSHGLSKLKKKTFPSKTPESEAVQGK
nr:unnamed protein product [Callosobruchus chinensis]